jgi:hypothetical protein
MIEHLSGEQISQWMIGERTPQVERHVAECAACRAEVEKLESTLAQFRMAVRELGSSAPAPAWRNAPFRAPTFTWPRLVLSTAALLVLIAAPIAWTTHERERSAEAALADSQLLERVDSAISRAVPEPMEPLVNLVTWNSSAPVQNQKAVKQ